MWRDLPKPLSKLKKEAEEEAEKDGKYKNWTPEQLEHRIKVIYRRVKAEQERRHGQQAR
jgi:hypothetical protein